MPHATQRELEDNQDEALIQRLLATNNEDSGLLDFDRDLEPGEKADDAVDYEDLGDDDLADDEEPDDGQRPQMRHGYRDGPSSKDSKASVQDDDFPTLTIGNHDENDGFDDLFCDESSSPVDAKASRGSAQRKHIPDDLFNFEDGGLLNAHDGAQTMSIFPNAHKYPNQSATRVPALSLKDPLSVKERYQQDLFAMSRPGFGNVDVLPAPPKNQEELLATLWPKFKRDTVPKFMDLLPPKKARYLGKIIPKQPKSVNPTKVNLELAQDETKSFKTSSMPSKPTRANIDHIGIVTIHNDNVEEQGGEEDVDMESDFERDIVGGVSWQDLQIVCEDWDSCNISVSTTSAQAWSRRPGAETQDIHGSLNNDDDWDMGTLSAKVGSKQYIRRNYTHVVL